MWIEDTWHLENNQPLLTQTCKVKDTALILEYPLFLKDKLILGLVPSPKYWNILTMYKKNCHWQSRIFRHIKIYRKITKAIFLIKEENIKREAPSKMHCNRFGIYLFSSFYWKIHKQTKNTPPISWFRFFQLSVKPRLPSNTLGVSQVQLSEISVKDLTDQAPAKVCHQRWCTGQGQGKPCPALENTSEQRALLTILILTWQVKNGRHCSLEN